MSGCLTVRRGIVYVGRYDIAAHVSLFDLDGRSLPGGFSYGGSDGGRAEVLRIAVDGDRRVWVADAAGDRVLGYHALGREMACVRGGIERPVAVVARGNSEELELCIGLAGTRRGAVLVYGPELGAPRRLRSLGDPLAPFARVSDLAIGGRDLYVCEAGARRIQVFRDFEHHWTIPLARELGEPCALALAEEGRLVIAFAGERPALALVDAAGDLVRILAEHGTEDGCVHHPGGVAVVSGNSDRETRALAVDREGERVQVFTLEGRCYGSFSAATA